MHKRLLQYKILHIKNFQDYYFFSMFCLDSEKIKKNKNKNLSYVKKNDEKDA